MSRTVVADGVTHNFPDDASDQDIAQALSNYSPAPSAQASTLPDLPQSPVPGAINTAANLLPAVLGGLGGIAGGGTGALGLGIGAVPGAVAGAGLGSAAGEAARRAILEAWGGQKSGLAETAKAAGVQGLVGAGSELAGQGIAKAAMSLGGIISGKILGPAAAKTEDLVRTAAQHGVKIPLSVLDEGVDQIATKAGLTSQKAAKGVYDAMDDLLGGIKTTHIPADYAHQVKIAADAEAQALREAEKKGSYIPAVERVRARVMKQVANNLNQALRDEIPAGRFGKQGYQELNKQTQRIIVARQVARYAARPLGAIAGAGAAGAVPGGGDWRVRALAGGLAGGAAASPQVMEAAGNLLMHPAVQAILGQAPRAAVGGLQAIQ